MRPKARFAGWVSQCVLTLMLACPMFAFSQANYPSKPIRLVIPYPPGGSTNIVGRLIGQKLTESWGQQVVMDNRGGGNTILGSEALLRTTPDGYTLMHVTSAHTINPNLMATPYDPVKDFAPVATVIQTQTLMVVNTTVAASNVHELIALAKSKPGQLNFGSSGTGTNNHLSGELFGIMAGIKIQHIPYKGAGPAITGLIGGQVQIFMNNALPLAPFVKSGKVRPIAISGVKRLRSLPEVPTFTEAGFPGFDVRGWHGILAPAKTPPPIIAMLSREIMRILNTQEFSESLVTIGAEPFISTPEQFGALIKTELARYAKLIKQANIKLE